MLPSLLAYLQSRSLSERHGVVAVLASDGCQQLKAQGSSALLLPALHQQRKIIIPWLVADTS